MSEPRSDIIFLTIAILSSITSICVVVIGQWMNARYSKQTQEGAMRIAEAAERTEKEKQSTTDKYRLLIEAARGSRREVADVGRNVESTRIISQDTNKHVRNISDNLNGQTTELLLTIYRLADRLARDHPEDQELQMAAADAKQAYEDSNEKKNRR